MRRLTVAVTASAVVTGGLLLAGCAGTGSSPGSASRPTPQSAPLPAQTLTVDEVTIKAAPERLDAGGATIELTLDTHTTPLDMALPSSATLTVADRSWPAVGWDGDPPGGHHREGRLRFRGSGPDRGAVEFSLGGLSRPAVFRWTAAAR